MKWLEQHHAWPMGYWLDLGGSSTDQVIGEEISKGDPAESETLQGYGYQVLLIPWWALETRFFLSNSIFCRLFSPSCRIPHVSSIKPWKFSGRAIICWLHPSFLVDGFQRMNDSTAIDSNLKQLTPPIPTARCLEEIPMLRLKILGIPEILLVLIQNGSQNGMATPCHRFSETHS